MVKVKNRVYFINECLIEKVEMINDDMVATLKTGEQVKIEKEDYGKVKA